MCVLYCEIITLKKNDLYSCVFGLANIYCPNWIAYQNSEEKKYGTHSYTILREFVIQLVLITENIIMLIIVVYSATSNDQSVIYGQRILMYVAITAGKEGRHFKESA